MQSLTVLADTARRLKENMEFEDVIAFIHVFPSDIVVPLQPFDDEVHLAQFITNINVAHGDVEGVVLVADAYRMKDGSNAAPGALQARWDAGDRDDITESLLVVRVDKDSSESIEMDFEAATKTWTDEKMMDSPDEPLVKAMRLGAFSEAADGSHAADHRALIETARDSKPLLAMTRVVLQAQTVAALTGQFLPPEQVIASLSKEIVAARDSVPDTPPTTTVDPYKRVRLTDYLNT